MLSNCNVPWSLAVTVLISLLSLPLTFGCTCMVMHPQTHFCNYDFAFLIRVKKADVNEADRTVAYHVVVKKTFKMTEKASISLKSKIIWTPLDEATCGVKLHRNTTYIVTGRTISNKLNVNLCNFHQPWDTLTKKQKKGFRLLYKQGCECKIQPTYYNYPQSPKNRNTCLWVRDMPGKQNGACQSNHTVCMHQANGECGWNTSRNYRLCLKKQQRERKRKLMEP